MSFKSLMREIRFKATKASWYRTVFTSPDGELVLADLIKFTHAHDQSHTPGDPLETAFNEGMRRVVTRIEKLAHMTPAEIRRLAEAHRRAEESLGRDNEEYAA